MGMNTKVEKNLFKLFRTSRSRKSCGFCSFVAFVETVAFFKYFFSFCILNNSYSYFFDSLIIHIFFYFTIDIVLLPLRNILHHKTYPGSRQYPGYSLKG